MNGSNAVPIFRLGEHPELFRRPALLLSASIPYLRSPDCLPPGSDPATNLRFLETMEPERTREAVAHLCRFAFQRDLGLVFGGHPAISPMVLEAARLFGPAESREHTRRVVIFQSAYFLEEIPQEAWQLDEEELGTLLWTEPEPAEAPDRWRSLEEMRRVMVGSPNLVGAIFVGGMEGTLDEARLCQQRGLPCFALGATGSAACMLLEGRGDGRFWGERASRELLATSVSLPLILQRVFEDLGIA